MTDEFSECDTCPSLGTPKCPFKLSAGYIAAMRKMQKTEAGASKGDTCGKNAKTGKYSKVSLSTVNLNRAMRIADSVFSVIATSCNEDKGQMYIVYRILKNVFDNHLGITTPPASNAILDHVINSAIKRVSTSGIKNPNPNQDDFISLGDLYSKADREKYK